MSTRTDPTRILTHKARTRTDPKNEDKDENRTMFPLFFFGGGAHVRGNIVTDFPWTRTDL